MDVEREVRTYLGTYGGMNLPGQNKSELYYTTKEMSKTQVCKHIAKPFQ
jgi:hypothetical protein